MTTALATTLVRTRSRDQATTCCVPGCDAPRHQISTRNRSRFCTEHYKTRDQRLRSCNQLKIVSTDAARNPLPDNPIDDPQPNFDAPRLIQRVDALAYSLPMRTPSGERCYVTLVGSFAAWGETMTALVREGFTQAEPERWKDGAK